MSFANTTEATPRRAQINPPRRADSRLLLGDFATYNQDPVNYFLETGKVSPITRTRFIWIDNVIVTDAEFAKEILQTRNRNYVKEPRMMKIFETGSDKVMFTTDGDEWIWRRRLMQPAFHRKQIAQFCDAIVAETEKELATWRSGTTIDVDEAMKLLTMMIIGRTMFNVDMAGDSADLHTAYRTIGRFIIDRLSTPVSPPMWMPTPGNRAFWEANETIRSALTTIMEARRESSEPHNDLLDMLLGMVNVDDGFTQNQLIYEMSSIVFAGHETTATTLTWLIYALSQHSDVEQKLLNELDTVLKGRTPTMDDLANLPYLNQVINETLRLYPAARATTRQAVEADVIGGYTIRKGENIFINIEGIHRDERYWDEPETFDPERFSAERSAGRHKWAFIPFLNGPRKCIGEPLSRTEMQLILATALQRFRFRLPEGATVEKEAAFVLQPKGGLPMILEAR